MIGGHTNLLSRVYLKCIDLIGVCINLLTGYFEYTINTQVLNTFFLYKFIDEDAIRYPFVVDVSMMYHFMIIVYY
jgi:hypothetical protein